MTAAALYACALPLVERGCLEPRRTRCLAPPSGTLLPAETTSSGPSIRTIELVATTACNPATSDLQAPGTMLTAVDRTRAIEPQGGTVTTSLKQRDRQAAQPGPDVLPGLQLPQSRSGGPTEG